MDFFATNCQQGPFKDKQFGLCDDQNSSRAYVDKIDPAKWLVSVKNEQGKFVTFTAIDKCVIKDDEELGRGRCDCMLTTAEILYLIELKNKKSPWLSLAVEQLESTIQFLMKHHDISAYVHKKAIGCNKRPRILPEISISDNKRFFQTYGFRLELQAEIIIL